MNNLLLALETGVDIPFEECQLVIHQPSIKEISLIGERTFFSGVQILTIQKEFYFDKDETELNNLTNFQIFMTIMLDKQGKEQKKIVEQTLSLFLPNYKVAFTPQSMLLTLEGQVGMIDSNTFDKFQDLISAIVCSRSGENGSYNPVNAPKAKAIARKMEENRRRLAAQKGEDNNEAGNLASYISSIAVGFSLDLNTVKNYTIFQVYDIMQRYQLYLTWDLDIRSRLAGGKPDETPENWMKNIHNV